MIEIELLKILALCLASFSVGGGVFIGLDFCGV